jgi:hypothetical protein
VAVSPAARRQHGFGDCRQWKNLFSGAEFDRFARHAVDYASGLVLGDGAAAGLPDLHQAMSAIVAHAGEQRTYRVGACGFGNGRKEDVN